MTLHREIYYALKEVWKRCAKNLRLYPQNYSDTTQHEWFLQIQELKVHKGTKITHF